ncbi:MULTISPECIES: tRNA (adenosine(37)-N6)-threonylcarbamoyltransferase complex ATPase subunit type 1 TsaE [Methylotenera]|uniref:tRNA (adenosine(37)-N6)-threonylcarbamoyltransferase complex ATPase subunit type 1 TsaE n=1 Tax=Methylotenera TaxID=359407 RepID=UPI0003663C19|nr:MULTISPECIES: tRNA (adenosine(37)-N6)-threonylcarbamoyltransferase complex ATPase subunit type 1 TsaE [Methylotenera]
MANDITFSSALISVLLDEPLVKQAALSDEAATLSAGAQFAKYLTSLSSNQARNQETSGLVIYLHGDLGAGKTTFTRGFIQSLGFVGKVKSPTYTLVEPYVFSSYNIYHFDLYRFTDTEDWEASGFREYFNAQSICLIEWPEKAADLLPEADIHVYLIHDDLQRKIHFLVNNEQDKRFNLTQFKLQ